MSIKNKGFTLIEILIVLAIIGITLGFALIAFGDFGQGRRIIFAAEQVANTLRLAQQEALLESSTLGLRVDNKSYQIVKFHETSKWSSGSDRGIFKINYFPKNTWINLKINRTPEQGSPAIIITSSGEMSPFILDFGTNKNTILTTLTGSHDGSLTFSAVNMK